MYVKSNTLQKYIDVFGDERLTVAINKNKSKKSSTKIIDVTNPIMRFLMETTYVHEGKLYVHKNPLISSQEDYSYFRLGSAILADLALEIGANESYKNQIADDFLARDLGAMLGGLNEVLVAGYYKYLGIKVALNSSAQPGIADIDLVELPFATDTKTFPNQRLYLEDIVNSSMKELVGAVRLVTNQDLLIHVMSPDKKKFHESMKNLAKAFEDTSIGHYYNDNVRANILDRPHQYNGANFSINVQPQNVNILFQANWDMGPAVEAVKTHIDKAVLQAKKLSKQAIPWIMIPRDANNQGIEANVLRFFGKFHQLVLDNEDIFILPVYSLEFEGKGMKTVFDVFETGRNTLKVNSDTFQTYIKGLMSRPEMFI